MKRYQMMCRQVVQQLTAAGVQVVALARDAQSASVQMPQANVTVIEGDLYQFSSLPPALAGCDAVICAAGCTDMLDPLGPFKVDYSVHPTFPFACRGIQFFQAASAIWPLFSRMAGCRAQ